MMNTQEQKEFHCMLMFFFETAASSASVSLVDPV